MPSLFDSDQLNRRDRNVADSLVLCLITDVRYVSGKVREDGGPSRDILFVKLALDQEAKDSEGAKLEPGFVKEVGFGWYPATQGEEKLETTNRITAERVRELIVATLDLPANHDDPKGELASQGGYQALKGKSVLVSFSNRRNMQNVDQFLKPAAARK